MPAIATDELIIEDGNTIAFEDVNLTDEGEEEDAGAVLTPIDGASDSVEAY